MNYLYIDNEYLPKSCAECPYYNKYKYCNLLNIKIENATNHRYSECPLRSITDIIEFYINNLKAVIASYNQLLSTYEFIEYTAEEYIEKAKNLIK